MATATYEEIEATLREATPAGWYIGSLAVDVAWYPRPGHPRYTYRCEGYSGRVVGARPRYYSGGEGATYVGRRLTVRLSAPSLDALVAAVRELPKFEFLFDLPSGTEVDVDSYDL